MAAAMTSVAGLYFVAVIVLLATRRLTKVAILHADHEAAA
jgi:hypothetical protein